MPARRAPRLLDTLAPTAQYVKLTAAKITAAIAQRSNGVAFELVFGAGCLTLVMDKVGPCAAAVWSPARAIGGGSGGSTKPAWRHLKQRVPFRVLRSPQTAQSGRNNQYALASKRRRRRPAIRHQCLAGAPRFYSRLGARQSTARFWVQLGTMLAPRRSSCSKRRSATATASGNREADAT